MSNGLTSRTAVYGPVRTVVWQGSAGNRCPYADQVGITPVYRKPANLALSPDAGLGQEKAGHKPRWPAPRQFLGLAELNDHTSQAEACATTVFGHHA
jgi:hypothetical protein